MVRMRDIFQGFVSRSSRSRQNSGAIRNRVTFRKHPGLWKSEELGGGLSGAVDGHQPRNV